MFKSGTVWLSAPASIKFNELEWTETADGYIECDLGLMRWEIQLIKKYRHWCEFDTVDITSVNLRLNERYFIGNFDTVDIAKSVANNMMQEFIDKFCFYG
jgi:hypothetical protein